MSTPKEISRNELESFKKQYHTDYSIGDLTPTVCELLALPEPEGCGGTPIPMVIDHAAKLFDGDGKLQKLLVFCPDAVGEKHRLQYPELLERVQKLAGLRCLSSGVMPSVTPVCFATIFSGCSPEIHGIHKWEQPVLKIETLFDVAAKAGKKVAIVAKNCCSIDRIFRNRDVSYFSCRCDAESRRITELLLEHADYDIIISYAYNHDYSAHKTGPDSPETIAELTTCVETFEALTPLVDRVWKKFNHAVIWAPDHGNHPIGERQGAHGDNIPEDMLVNHFYRIIPAE